MALREWARQPRNRRAGAVALALVAVYVLAGFLAVPPLVRSVLESRLTKALHRRTTVEAVSFNPVTLSARVRGVTVREPGSDEPFVSLGEVYANVKLTALLRLAPVLKELRLADVRVRLVRREDLTYNFSDLLAPPPAGQPASKPPRYALNNIQLIRGGIDFDDRPVKKLHTVRNLYVAIPSLSNLPDETEVFVQPALRAVVNGTPFALGGRTKPFSDSLETSLDINIRDLDLPGYLAYLPAPLPVKVTSAHLTTQLTLTFRQERGKPATRDLAGRLTLRDVAIADARGAELFATPLFEVHLTSANLLAGRAQMASVLVEQPRLRVTRDAGGSWNLERLAPVRSATTPPAGTSEGPPFLFEVTDLKVTGGTVRLTDATTRPPFEATLGDVELGVRGLSTEKGRTAAVELSLSSDAGERLRQTGHLSLEPRAASGTFDVAGVPLRRYAPYVPAGLAFEIADGVLGLSGAYAWSGAVGGGLTLSNLGGTVHSLRLRGSGNGAEFLAVADAGMQATGVDLPGSNLTLGELSLSGVRLVLARGTDGIWNLAKLLAPPPASPAAAPGWSFALKRLSVEKGEITVDDALPARPVRFAVTPLSLTVRDLSTIGGARGTLELRGAVNGSGSVSLKGDVGVNPVSARLAAEITALPLVPLQGYVSDRVRVLVNDGTASASGTVTVSPAGAASTFGFEGRAAVDRFAAVDVDAAEDLLKWGSLSFDRVSWVSDPFALGVDRIALSGLAARIVVAPDGISNLRRALGGGAPPPAADEEGEADEPAAAATPTPVPSPTPVPAPDAAPEAPPAVHIGRLELRDGAVTFLDRSVSPEIRLEIGGVTGSVAGMTSLASSAADVDVRATLNGQAPVTATGKVNPLAGNLFLDLKVAGRDFDLPSVSTYSGTYAGYAIQRGKLSVDLAYTVRQRRLDSQNKLMIDQFDFGDKVESPKATKLPVRLAVSLLKDREGRITLDLPVSGSLDDPKFRVGRVIMKMIGHLLVKVATSPFALLGSLFGGAGAELNTVVFAPGSSVLDDTARAHLDTLAKALYDRPALRLDVSGVFDQAADREGLRQLGLQRAVKREKLDDLVKEGGTAPSLDAVVVQPEEYETYLKRAYKHGRFSKPRNFLGIASAEPVPEMERLLLASLDPGQDALRQLAAARAEAVQGYLLHNGTVRAEQVFVVAPSGVPAGKGPATRADLSLK